MCPYAIEIRDFPYLCCKIQHWAPVACPATHKECLIFKISKINMEYVTFIVHLRGGQRITVNSRYREDREHEVDAAWDWIRDQYPDAEYIERF